MIKLLIILILAAATAAVEFKQGINCTDLDCSDRPGTICQMVTFECTMPSCAPTSYCVPKAKSCAVKRCAPGMQCVVKLGPCSSDDPACKHRPTCVKYPKCGANEEYRECNGEGEDGKDCQESCTDKYPYCSNCGKGGCVCKAGFIRHNGKCIDWEKCPDPDCPVNQVWSKCPRDCGQQSCRSLLVKQTEKCEDGCGISQCICKHGFVRDDDYACIRRETCPKKFDCASPNEVKKQCSSMCEPTCANREPVCNKRCGPPKCQCKPGYVIHDGRCINSAQCPQD